MFKFSPLLWWKNTSISKKLYVVFGIMTVLIAIELLTLSFAMETLSSVRAFVGGEGLWSKSQKDAVTNLQAYVVTKNESYYQSFNKTLEIPRGDHKARLELEKANPDMQTVYDGFQQGNIHHDDIKGMVVLLTRFSRMSFIVNTIQAWRNADELLTQLTTVGEEVHSKILTKSFLASDLETYLQKVSQLNNQLTREEDRFSAVLSDGSRWVERTLFFAVLFLVLTVETAGLTFTFNFSRYLSRGLMELNQNTVGISEGDFSKRATIHANDELGQLANSVNKLAESLESNIDMRLEAEEHSRAKDLFLANMSHEIRTPLGIILGFIELLKENNLPPEEKQSYFETIQKSGTTLTGIISDILDISRIESGRLSIEYSSFSLHTLLKDIRVFLSLKCEENGIDFKIVQNDNLPDQISCDPTRLKQILINLLNNSIKFTTNGAVTLSASLKNNDLVFDVEDTGKGIEKKDWKRIFEPFEQGDNRLNKKYSGTGLGLALSAHLAKLLGGGIELMGSEEGKGSHFRLIVAYQAAQKGQQDSARAIDASKITLDNVNVLVVDDSSDARIFMKKMLEKWGCKVELAEDGKVAIDKIKSKSFDVVLMDIQMPTMNGIQATRMLRQMNYWKPIIAVTATALKTDRQLFAQAGCDDYLSKPIDLELLVQKISKFGQTV